MRSPGLPSTGTLTRLTAWCDRHTFAIVIGFSALFFASVLGPARQVPVAHDEVFTIVTASLPSWALVRDAYLDGIDLQPPLHTIATRLIFDAAGISTSSDPDGRCSTI
jgi:hypothetical protein